MMAYAKTPLAVRFASKLRKGAGCWEWTGSKCGNGYGHIWDGAKMIHAHRAAWIIANGSIPTGMSVLHKCDTPLCVNPDHLFLGTQRDNLRDCASKGRLKQQRDPLLGERVGTHKLTEDDVRKIRSLRGSTTIPQLARMFSVGHAAIERVIYCKTWTHLAEGE